MIGSLIDLVKGRYTLKELMSIDPNRQQRAQDCSVKLVDTFFSIKEESLAQKFRSLLSANIVKVFYITLKLEVTSDTGHTHTVFIQLEPDFTSRDWGDNKVRIYCDCADFKYRSAFILNKRDSLFVNSFTKIALGSALSEEPKTKTKTTTLCKHCYAALNWVLNNYNSIMNTL